MSSLSMEWQKLLPLHRTSRTVVTAIGLAVGVSAVVAAAMAAHAAHMTRLERARFDSVGVSLQGINAAVLAIAVFGVLCITREYSTGMITTTFLAQPSRLRVLFAKLGTHSAVACVAGAAASAAAYAVGQALLGTAGLDVGWGAHGLPRALAAGALYLVLVCVWGVAIGALTRSSASAITWIASLLVVAPVIVQILPASVVQLVGRWLPSQIGMQAIAGHADPHSFSPWLGLGVLAGYVALTLAAGAWRMVRVDP
jgi:ABC-type transport system involved in multi-copper enzyme maturation permease subunit